MACSKCNNTCREDCTEACGFYCSNGWCDNACYAECSESCSLSCREGCRSSCQTACNTTCQGQTQKDNIDKIVNNKSFTAEFMNNINTAVNFELARRGLSPSIQNIVFKSKEKIDDEKVNNIINNLKQTGQNISYSANYKTLALESFAQNIIDTIINANNKEIKLDTIE